MKDTRIAVLLTERQANALYVGVSHVAELAQDPDVTAALAAIEAALERPEGEVWDGWATPWPARNFRCRYYILEEEVPNSCPVLVVSIPNAAGEKR